MNNTMNRRRAILLVSAACITRSSRAAEAEAETATAPLAATALEALKQAPEIKGEPLPPKGFSNAPAAPPKEVSRSYEALPGKGMRVVITRDDGSEKVCPCAEIPILFDKSKSTLAADKQTRQNLAELNKFLQQQGSGKFAVEGHASAEGDVQFNQNLSEARAKTVYQELLRQGVSSATLPETRGRGTRYAHHKADAPEKLLREDRRVLVVREG